MAPDAAFTFAHTEFYEPSNSPTPDAATGPPSHRWLDQPRDRVWTQWAPPSSKVRRTGWKVHVSAALAGAQHVLDVVALRGGLRRCRQALTEPRSSYPARPRRRPHP